MAIGTGTGAGIGDIWCGLPERAAWKDVPMPKPCPIEFREDVVRVARTRESGVTIEQVAADFGVHPMTLSKWLRRADIDERTRPG